MYLEIRVNATTLSVANHSVFPRKTWEKEVQSPFYLLTKYLIFGYSFLSQFSKPLTDSIERTSDQEQLSQMCGLACHLKMEWQLSKFSEERIRQFFMDWSEIYQNGRGLRGTLLHCALGITDDTVRLSMMLSNYSKFTRKHFIMRLE